MIKVEGIAVWGFKHAIRGMRNPMNSWDKSDSYYSIFDGKYIIAPYDMGLAKKLIAAGPEHRKFLRQIFVSMDITAPLYWWKEFDTYKVGTAANSCSTMHKIAAKEFTLEDFSHEHLLGESSGNEGIKKLEGEDFSMYEIFPDNVLDDVVQCLNWARLKYLETMDKKYWWQMIQLLPSSYNQMRTVTMNYENVYSMIRQRTDHKLDEWNDFVLILWALPYVKDMFVFTTEGQND